MVRTCGKSEDVQGGPNLTSLTLKKRKFSLAGCRERGRRGVLAARPPTELGREWQGLSSGASQQGPQSTAQAPDLCQILGRARETTPRP